MAIKEKDQQTGGTINTAGPDTPGYTATDANSQDFFDQDATVFFMELLGQEPPDDKSKYDDISSTEKSKSKKLEDVRKKVAPSGDKPTTASVKKGKKSLPSVIQEADPQKQAQVMPELYKSMQTIMGMLSMGGGLGGGGGGEGEPFIVTGVPSSMSVVLTDGFAGALAILVRKFGFETVIKMFVLITLPNGGLQQLDSWYQPVVTNAISVLLKVALYYGPLNIPVSSYDETYYGDFVPPNVVESTNIPNFYVKQYYGISNEPYPGYDQWMDPTNSANVVYVKRAAQSYVFSSAAEEIYSTVEQGIADDLDKYFYVDPTQYTIAQGAEPLFPRYLNDVLDKWIKQIEVSQGDLMIGANVGSGSGGNNMAGMMGMLLGLLQQLMQMFQQNQIGSKNKCVTPDMTQIFQDFQKQLGMSTQVLNIAMSAVGGGGLGNIAGMVGGMGGLGSLGDVLGAAGLGDLGGMLGGLMGGIGGLGGGSNGGGGGAGSGFPEASIGGSAAWNDTTNSGLTNSQIEDMQTIVSLLGLNSSNTTISSSSNTTTSNTA
jgi:hypothetical protein